MGADRFSSPRRRGVAAVELAIVLPILAFLLMIAIDYCRVFYHVQVVDDGARSAALYASGTSLPGPGQSTNAAAVAAAVAAGANLDPPIKAEDVSVTSSSTSVAVTVRYQFRTVAAFPGIPATVNLTRTVSMPRVAGQTP
jgi:Flp pilus assembly protein TadG